MLSAKYSSLAESDLAAYAEYLQRSSVEAAVRFLEAFDETIDFLKRSPEAGGRCALTNPLLAGTRVWRIKGFENHLIFYRLHPNEIEVVRILHGSRDLELIFGESES